MKFHHSKITSISYKGLKYVDNNNEEMLIDFHECRKNWVKYMNTSEYFEASKLKEDDTVCVAWRDAFHEPPYIEFFSEPKIQFIYPYKRTFYEWIRNMSSYEGYWYFRETCIEIERYGWTTFDLG